jgi:hypothetical protein
MLVAATTIRDEACDPTTEHLETVDCLISRKGLLPSFRLLAMEAVQDSGTTTSGGSAGQPGTPTVQLLPIDKVFPIQIGSEVFRISYLAKYR